MPFLLFMAIPSVPLAPATVAGSKVDLTRATPTPGSSLPPQVLLQMQQELSRQPAKKNSNDVGGAIASSAAQDQPLSMPAFNEVNLAKMSSAATPVKGKSSTKAGKPLKGKHEKGFKASGSSGTPIHLE